MTKTGKILRGLLLAALLPLLCGCRAQKASTEFFAMDTVMQHTVHTQTRRWMLPRSRLQDSTRSFRRRM